MVEKVEADARLLRRGWLVEQPAPLQAAVLQRGRLVSHAAGTFLFHAGDGPGGIYGVVCGGIGIHVPAASGETTLVHIGRCGAWVGYGPLVRGGRRSLSFSLIEPTYLLHVPLPALQEIGQSAPEFQRAILAITEYGMDVAIAIVGTLTIRDPARRLAATLLRIVPPDPEDHSDGVAEIRLRQAELGEMSSLDRRVVNRILKQMERRGWLSLSYGRIRIRDAAALTVLALS